MAELKMCSMESTGPHFFKIILESAIEDKKLMVPKAFVGRFGIELSSTATLTNPQGYVSLVGITEDDDGKLWFGDGWIEFVEYHSIGVGYYVVFQYMKDSDFHVLIYNPRICEIQYPPRSIFTPSRLSQATRGSSKSKNGSRLKAITWVMEKEDDSESDTANGSMVDIHGKSNAQRSVCPKMDCSESSEIDRTKFQNAKHFQKDVLRADTLDRGQFFALFANSNIHICRKCPSVEERQEAINVLRLVSHNLPSFLVFLRASSLRQYAVYVPASFSQKYFHGDVSVVVQGLDGRELAVKMNPYSFGQYVLNGWQEFFKKNNVKGGTILFFKMKKMKNIILKVSVH